MKKNSKIAIIGGGPMGLAVAYEFCLQGYKPTVYDSDNRLGGMAACSASGTMAVRYGTMRTTVLGLTVVMANGDIIKTGSRAKKTSAGYNLTNLHLQAVKSLVEAEDVADVGELHSRKLKNFT